MSILHFSNPRVTQRDTQRGAGEAFQGALAAAPLLTFRAADHAVCSPYAGPLQPQECAWHGPRLLVQHSPQRRGACSPRRLHDHSFEVRTQSSPSSAGPRLSTTALSIAMCRVRKNLERCGWRKPSEAPPRLAAHGRKATSSSPFRIPTHTCTCPVFLISDCRDSALPRPRRQAYRRTAMHAHTLSVGSSLHTRFLRHSPLRGHATHTHARTQHAHQRLCSRDTCSAITCVVFRAHERERAALLGDTLVRPCAFVFPCNIESVISFDEGSLLF